LTINLAGVGILLAITYPFSKRYTYLAQIHLGTAFGWAIPMAFAAATGSLPPLAWLIFCAAILWAIIYDTEYAMVDREDDMKLGLKSTAILFGDADRVIIGLLQAVMIVNMLLIGNQAEMCWPYYLAIGASAGLFIRQQYLLRDRSRQGSFAAFMNNNWVGGVIFAGIGLNYMNYPAV